MGGASPSRAKQLPEKILTSTNNIQSEQSKFIMPLTTDNCLSSIAGCCPGWKVEMECKLRPPDYPPRQSALNGA